MGGRGMTSKVGAAGGGKKAITQYKYTDFIYDTAVKVIAEMSFDDLVKGKTLVSDDVLSGSVNAFAAQYSDVDKSKLLNDTKEYIDRTALHHLDTSGANAQRAEGIKAGDLISADFRKPDGGIKQAQWDFTDTGMKGPVRSVKVTQVKVGKNTIDIFGISKMGNNKKVHKRFNKREAILKYKK